MNPKHIAISDYTYTLPTGMIALYPLPERDESKLLVWDQGLIRQDIFKNIAEYLPANSLVIFNDTRVIQARVLFHKSTGAVIEIFCLEPYDAITRDGIAMAGSGSAAWKCMIGGAGKWKEGFLEKSFIIGEEKVQLTVSLRKKLPDSYVAEFRWHPHKYSFLDILEHAGNVPLPPYIKRAGEPVDAERYQTVYAKYKGSVAAPTAGLHFTPAIFTALEEKKITTGFVTLHVGAGTFKPVTTATLELHNMHAEWIDISTATISEILEKINSNVIAAGTTSLRTLESMYWMGVKCLANPYADISAIEIKQWDVYDHHAIRQDIEPKDALAALLDWMNRNSMERLVAKTGILIAPGYRFRIADALITNFHQPGSTLLLLVATAVGDGWKKIYQYALENDFRFLSYGDGSLLNFRVASKSMGK
ncbi:MAG: S-adenosylmethionine:tRNA ribosyltransferase-isomerase [Ginsengibacter sp.]